MYHYYLPTLYILHLILMRDLQNICLEWSFCTRKFHLDKIFKQLLILLRHLNRIINIFYTFIIKEKTFFCLFFSCLSPGNRGRFSLAIQRARAHSVFQNGKSSVRLRCHAVRVKCSRIFHTFPYIIF